MTNPKKPLISIIIASFNRGDTLESTLKSIVGQDYPHKQLIVIDGGSEDESINLLKKYQNEIGYWVSEPDRGIAHAWNKGLAQAKGDWICFLGADDVFWDTTVLTCMVSHLVKQPENIRVVYGTVVVLSKKLEIVYIGGEPWKEMKNLFLAGVSMIPHNATMHRQSLFQTHGLFNEQFKMALDYDLLLRELKYNEAYFVPNLIVAAMLEGGVSGKNHLKTMKEFKQAAEFNGLGKWNLARTLSWLQSFVVAVIMRPLLGDKITEKIRNRILLRGKEDILLEIGEFRPLFLK
jgi:glycosyltransferase involved in cell wall biosynthesis